MKSPLCTALLWLLVASGCEQAPAEPTPTREPAPRPSRLPLSWSAPPGWTLEQSAERGSVRARYGIPSAGESKHPAELLVTVVEGGVDVGSMLDELLAQFEGEEVSRARREQFTVGTLEVELLDVGGTYKMPMGPQMGKSKKHAANVLKERWRAIAAGVKTQGRGTWMFRLLGPNDAVEAARGAFRAMIDGMQ